MPPMRMRRSQCRLRVGAMLIVFASVVLSEAHLWSEPGGDDDVVSSAD